MQKKNPAKRRPERLVVTLLSLLFLSTAVFATVKYVFRAPELDTDKPVVTPDGTASTDADRTDTDEPDAPGRTRRKYCYNILVSGLDDDNGGSDTNILINMDYDDPYQDLHIHFTKGPRHLNGQEAMEVVRFRHNNDGTGYGTEDIGRIGTQQAFLKAVAKQLLQIGNVKNIPALVDIFYTYVKTDLTTGNLVWLGNEALNIGTENIHFATLPGDGSGYYNKQSVYVLDAQATCDLVNEALNPYNEALTLEDMDILVP